MKLIYSGFSNNQRFPILINQQTNLPEYLPLLFTLIILKGKSLKTKSNHLVAIRMLFKYLHTKDISMNHIDDVDIILEQIDGFCSWLYNKGYTGKNNKTPISNQQFDIYIKAIRKFLEWFFLKSKTSHHSLRIVKAKLTVNLIHNPPKVKEYKSLTNEELSRIRSVIGINSIDNPFSDYLRLRNYLIVEILLQSGLRIGELLSVKIEDLKRSEDHNYYIEVKSRISDYEDSRKFKPSIKNQWSYRIVSINTEMNSLIDTYIMKFRKRISKKNKVNHGYLFISNSGKPISLMSMSYIFRQIKETVKSVYSEEIQLTPHVLRHTFANSFLEYLIEQEKLDMELAKDKLRQICGWSISSPMPIFYANKYINKKANEINVKRINALMHK